MYTEQRALLARQHLPHRTARTPPPYLAAVYKLSLFTQHSVSRRTQHSANDCTKAVSWQGTLRTRKLGIILGIRVAERLVTEILVRRKFWSSRPKFQKIGLPKPYFSEIFGVRVEQWSKHEPIVWASDGTQSEYSSEKKSLYSIRKPRYKNK